MTGIMQPVNREYCLNMTHLTDTSHQHCHGVNIQKYQKATTITLSSRRVQTLKYYLNTVENVLLLCDRQDVPLKGHCESQSSCNRRKLSRNYWINVVAKHDKIVSAVHSSLRTLFYSWIKHLVICLGWYFLVRANALYHHFTKTASPKYMYPIELRMHTQLSTTLPTHPPVQLYIYYVSLSHHQIDIYWRTSTRKILAQLLSVQVWRSFDSYFAAYGIAHVQQYIIFEHAQWSALCFAKVPHRLMGGGIMEVFSFSAAVFALLYLVSIQAALPRMY